MASHGGDLGHRFGLSSLTLFEVVKTSDLGISGVVSEFGIPIFVGAASCWQPVIAADQASGKQTGTFDRLVRNRPLVMN